MSVPDGLHFFDITETTVADTFRLDLLDTGVHRHRYRMRSYRNRIFMFMASYATLCFSRLQSRPATHGLYNAVVFIHCLEVYRRAARYFEEGRTVRLHIYRSQYPFYVPAGIADSYRGKGMSAATRVKAISGTDTGYAVDGFDNP